MNKDISKNPSGDREDRIAARRARIAARLAAKQKGEKEDESKKAEEKEKKNDTNKSKTQIAQSRKRLEKVKTEGDEQVNIIRVGGDLRESSRRVDEEGKTKARKAMLGEELTESEIENAAISMKWASLYEHNVPQELYQELRGQEDLCGQVIEQKDGVLKVLQQELKGQDEEYVKSLKRQAEDIDLLLDRMGRQFKSLSGAFEEELENIEKSFMIERGELIETNRKEIDELFQKRRNLEIKHMEKKRDRIESYHEELENLRVNDAEVHNLLKIKLETEIQTLEQQLQEMRATYQLNTEKLEYNFRVLTERDAENSHTMTQQKKKIARLHDILTGLMNKYAKQDKGYRDENLDLTSEYKRITEQFKDLQTKFRHFQTTDNQRYRQVWSLNESRVKELVHQVLQGDKVITEQQLGLEWTPPDLSFLEQPLELLGTSQTQTQTQTQTQASAQSPVSPAPTTPLTQKSGRESYTHPSPGPETVAKVRAKSHVVRQVLELLCDEAGFLVEEKVRTMLMALPHDQQNLLKLDSIFRALGVETEDDIDVLLSYFAPDGRGEAITEEESEEEEEEEEDEEEEEQGEEGGEKEGERETVEGERVGSGVPSVRVGVVDENQSEPQPLKTPREVAQETAVPSAAVIPALKAFLTHHRNLAAQSPGPVAQPLTDRAVTAGRGTRKQERLFWEKMAQVVDDDTYHVWHVLEKGLEDYHKILSSRANLITETASLKQQNDELKSLLNQYLQSDVNIALQVPPTMVIPELQNTLPNTLELS